MAADFTALFGHALAWERIESLPAALNERWSGETVVPLRRSQLPQKGWSFRPEDHRYHSLQAEFQEAGHLVLKGPDGFDGQVFRSGVFELYNWTRWWSFLGEPAATQALRQTCRLVAKVLRATFVIYLPDSHYAVSQARDLPYDGADLDQITAWLSEHGGPPAESIESIAARAANSPGDLNGYYVERF